MPAAPEPDVTLRNHGFAFHRKRGEFKPPGVPYGKDHADSRSAGQGPPTIPADSKMSIARGARERRHKPCFTEFLARSRGRE
jgi:hypothetical protein